MITAPMIPMIALPLTFLFVLLIILMAKAPKVGAWVVGGLVLLFPIFVIMLARTGALRHEEAIPLVALPTTFLFVLLLILLGKAPKVGAGLIVALVVMGVLGLLVAIPATHRRVGMERHELSNGEWPVPRAGTVRMEQSTADGRSKVVITQESDRAPESYVESPSPVPVPQVPLSPPALSPIWSEGLEQEFEADVYPSDVAAAKALGRQIAAPIRKVAGDPNATIEVVLFQEGNDRSLVEQFARAMEKELSGVRYAVEADLRNIRPGEVGLTLRREGQTHNGRIHNEGNPPAIESFEAGRIVATAFAEDRRASAEVSYIDKPWVENFAAFADARPNEHYIVVRSNGTCTSESEAHQQALDDARARLTEALGRQKQRDFAGLPLPTITTQDVLQGSFIVDRFAQSFAGSAGRIWRQALLIDVSGSKLAQLANAKTHESRRMRESWARMGFSVIGVVVLIAVIYFFLNMATMGYYEWSLRIAGIVLAMVAIFSVLMIVR